MFFGALGVILVCLILFVGCAYLLCFAVSGLFHAFDSVDVAMGVFGTMFGLIATIATGVLSYGMIAVFIDNGYYL